MIWFCPQLTGIKSTRITLYILTLTHITEPTPFLTPSILTNYIPEPNPPLTPSKFKLNYPEPNPLLHLEK